MMANLTIAMNLDNAAMKYDDSDEIYGGAVALSLEVLSRNFKENGISVPSGGVLRDDNGNTIGEWQIK